MKTKTLHLITDKIILHHKSYSDLLSPQNLLVRLTPDSRQLITPTTRGRRQYETKLAGNIPTRPLSSFPSHQSYWESVLVMTVIRSPGTKLRSPGCCPVNGWVAVTTREPVAPPTAANDDAPSSIERQRFFF